MPPFVRNFPCSIRAFVLVTIAFFLMSVLVMGQPIK
jgi:hypothetical protein